MSQADPTSEQAVAATRTPPHSSETETAVLSAWSLHDRFGRAWRPEPDLFHVSSHKLIAKAMADLDPSSRDQASVVAQLEANGDLTKAGGSGVVFRVINAAPAYGDPWPHVARLREYRAMRDVLGTVAVAVSEAYEHKNLGALVSKLQEGIQIGTANSGTTVLSVSDMIRAVAQRMLDRTEVKRCPTGVAGIDRDTGGYQYGQVSILGAATNWGKTAFSVMTSDVILGKGKRPLLISFEDSEEIYGRRLLSRRAKVAASELRDNSFQPSSESWDRILKEAETAERFPFFLNAIGKTAERVATDIRSICASEAIDIVLVDYIQAIQCARRQQDRRNEITYIGRIITDAIKSSRAAGLIFSQFRRQLKTGEKPTMHDLKECVAGDQVVLDSATGKRLTVRQLADGASAHVYAMTEDWQVASAPVAAAWSTGTKPILSLRTKSGRTLRATENHRLRTVGGWVAIRDLHIGQRIAAPRKLDQPTNCVDSYSDDELRMLGYLISDGHYGKHHVVSYVKADRALLEDVQKIAADRFGISAKLNGDHGKSEQLALTAGGTGPGSNRLIEWLKKIGIHGQIAQHKRVPADLLCHSDAALGVFLGALWAGDGCVVPRKRGGYTLKFASTSMGLLDDVQWILTRLGIVSAREVAVMRQTAKLPLANIVISEASAILRFAEVVPVPGVKGKRLSAAVEEVRLAKINERLDRLPIEVTEMVTKIAVASGTPYSDMKEKLGYKPQRKEMHRSSLAVFAEKTNCVDLADLAKANVFWDEIASIVPDGEEETFDLSVPGLHNFVVSNMFTHNSGDLENAAEMVLVGYRDEQGIPVVRVDKCKDGLKGLEYKLAWNTTYCGFEGELSEEAAYDRHH